MKLARVRTNSILNCLINSCILYNYILVLKKQKNERPLTIYDL